MSSIEFPIPHQDGNNLITKSIEPAYQRASKAAKADHVPILILAETGTGKEQLSKFIHRNSNEVRTKGPFVSINCTTSNEQLVESELFGHVKGAFTGAVETKEGLFKKADKGTLFIDEIGDMPLSTQAKLLRVIEYGEFNMVGSTKTEHVNVRIISATNKNPYKLIKEGKFRKDFYYRINGCPITLPSLRERGPEEMEQYLNYVIESESQKFNCPRLSFTPEALQIIKKYTFPGNFREMIGLVQGLYIERVESNLVNIRHLPSEMLNPDNHFSLSLDYAKKHHAKYVLGICENNKTKACEILGITAFTLREILKP